MHSSIVPVAEKTIWISSCAGPSSAFSALLHGLGFKQATTSSGSLPAVEDYYGYDSPSERIVHVHAHYQLIVGDDLTKNYRIPLEGAFLGATAREGGLRIPIPELELMLVIRLTLKHSTWDALLARRAKVSASAREELGFLRARADERVLHGLLEQHLPFVDRRAFDAAMESLDRGSATRARIRAGKRLVGQLEVCARRSRAADVRLKVWRRAVGTARARLRSLRRGDGLPPEARSSPSSAPTARGSRRASTACTPGSRDFAVRKVHLGRPPRSAVTVVARAVAKFALGLARVFDRSSPRRPGPHGQRTRKRLPQSRLRGTGSARIGARGEMPGTAGSSSATVSRYRSSASWTHRSSGTRPP